VFLYCIADHSASRQALDHCFHYHHYSRPINFLGANTMIPTYLVLSNISSSNHTP
jgi:hypothetical protein